MKTKFTPRLSIGDSSNTNLKSGGISDHRRCPDLSTLCQKWSVLVPVLVMCAVSALSALGQGALGGVKAIASQDFGVTALAHGKTQHLTSRDETPQGLSAPDWSGIRQQYEQHRHAAVPVNGGYQARNPGQQWQTRFDGRGFTTRPDTAGWQWGLELRSYGFPGHERAAAGQPRASAAGGRVAYDWDDTLQEWFINDSRGLEHGFTVRKRPAGTGDGLLVNLAVRGNLRPEVYADGNGVRLLDVQGAAAINYAGLTVFDADGRTLPARFEPVTLGENSLRLVIEERGARYPLTIDPIAQQAYLKASNTGAGDEFGLSVAVSEDTVVVGAPGESSNATGVNGNQSDNSALRSGAAYVFVRSGTTWIQQAYLKASNTGAEDFFGFSVAISGETVVVGAYGEDSNVTGVNGDANDNSAPNSGAAYVFVRGAGAHWTQRAYLKASNTGADDEFGDQFGVSVSVSDDTVVVGAWFEASNATGVNGNQSDNSAPYSGAAYVFGRSGTSWIQEAYLKASNTASDDVFGGSVAVSGNTVVVGAEAEDSNATGANGNQSDNSASYSGAAYVFVRGAGAAWTQQAYLKASNTGSDDAFGTAVAVSGDTVVVGAYGEASTATGVDGNQSDNNAPSSGAAYVFVRSGTSWTQQAYLKASNTEAGDNFGGDVSVSGDTVVVGAPYEDSNATGLNGNQSDNNAKDSGAAYFFLRSGNVWNQQAYLKASNTDAGDQFGWSVSVSGDTVVAGANWESSNATGVNGNQSDNSALKSGAAYIFTGLDAAPEIAVEQPAGTDLSDGLSSVDFGSGLVGGSCQRSFTIRNTGTADLTGLGITITGLNANEFTVTANPVAPVSGGNSTTFTITFSPGSAGVRTAVLHIASNDSDESPFDITLSGTGLTPLQVAQQAYLKASNTGGGDLFGYSVAVSGDTVVVGAVGDNSNATGVNGNQDDNSAPHSGAAYVFVRSGATWTQQGYLKASNTGEDDLFGWSVAVSGDTVVVGANAESSSATGVNGNQNDNSAVWSGAAYVFVRSGTTWSQQAYLKASNTNEQDFFGWSVAVSGDTVVVGAYEEDSNATGAGAAYVFVRSGTTWSQQAYLKASNTSENDLFGWSVSVSGDTVVVGARSESNNATGVNGNENNCCADGSGAAYIFVRSGTVWSQQAYLKASNTGTIDQFGWSVAVTGNTVVVGAPEEDSNATGVNGNQSDNSASASGAAYVFVRNGTTWTQQAYLKASNTGGGGFQGDRFGDSVAVSDNMVVVGAPYESSNATGVNGNQLDNSAYRSGAAYVFVRNGTIWSQQAYLKASNTGGPSAVGDNADQFGTSVAVSGETVVVGAPYEDSNATGVNSNQSDNSAFNSGAAYIFTGFGSGSGLAPQLVIVPAAGGGYFLHFNGLPGCTYRLQRATSVTGPWDTIATLTAPASGLTEYHEATPPAGQAFYRTVQP